MGKLWDDEEIKKLQESGQKLIFRTVEERQFTSFWKITVRTYIYDITDFLEASSHPGGPMCLERAVKSGNNTQYDYLLHRHSGRSKWDDYLIGEKKTPDEV